MVGKTTHSTTLIGLGCALFFAACGGQASSVSRGGTGDGATRNGNGGDGGEESGTGGMLGKDAGSGGDVTAAGGTTGAGGAHAGGAMAAAGNRAAIDAGTPSEKAAACAHMFEVTHSTRCGGPGLAADEAQRELPLFQKSCVTGFDAPGNGVTAAQLDACAAAYEIADCNLVDGPPQECDFHGLAPPGAHCFSGTQCASGNCRGDVGINPGGGGLSFACGICSDFAQVGEVCESVCTAGSVCVLTSRDASVYRCAAIHVGAEGTACDELANLCKNDLFCDRDSRRCVPLRGLGEPCGSMYPTGCTAPNYCDGAPGTCRAPAAQGEDCSKGQTCAAGLACDVMTQECAPVEWQDQAKPCDIGVHRCRSGSCQVGSVFPGATGTCPLIAGNGELCDDTTRVCDAGKACYRGICVNEYDPGCP